MEQVRIEYFGHSCFRLSGCGQRVVVDPYADGSVPGCPELRLDAEFVYCSHGHQDHNAVECVSLHDSGAPKFSVTELETDHDNARGKLRGKNTIRIFDFDGVRIAHFGDLGRPLTEAETAALQGLDCALLPVGGFFTIDAAQAAEIARTIRPRMVIPMHYRTESAGYHVIAKLDSALKKFDSSLNVVTLTYGGHAVVEYDLDKMTGEEKAKLFHDNGCNCCQATLRLLGKQTGLPDPLAISIGAGFGGGMLTGNVCGAVTGGMMAIGVCCVNGEKPAEERERSRQLCEALQTSFKEKYGTLLCVDILAAHDHDLCNECIAFAADTAEEIIRKNRL